MSDTYSIRINFEKGDFDKSKLPHNQGIYCIYKCKPWTLLTMTFPDQKKIRYIGQAKDLYNRLAGHEKVEECQKELEDGEELYFTWALISDEKTLNVAEAALIHHFRPFHNSDFKDHFPFANTHVTVSDSVGTLNGSFCVRCTEQTPERP